MSSEGRGKEGRVDVPQEVTCLSKALGVLKTEARGVSLPARFQSRCLSTPVEQWAAHFRHAVPLT